MADNWHKAKEIFNEALCLSDSRRDAYIRDACGRDDSLRKEVESLLSSFKGMEDFLQEPAVAIPDQDAPTIVDTPRLDPGTNVGHYKILDHLGAGGMGEVYLAQDPRLDRTVVLKFLSGGFRMDDVARKRFLREARMASAVDHPNVCTIYEISQYDDIDVIAMQYVQGKTLRDIIGGQPVEIQELLSIAKQIVDGLAAAHALGIIHRDLKPANIIVTPKGMVKILDFGLAKPLDGSQPRDATLTQEGTFVGTPAYMSPEQIKGQQVDIRSDIFSLGAILYEMATGTAAFNDGTRSTIDILHAVVYEEPVPIAKTGDDALSRLASVIGKCLEKDPARRYGSLDEVLKDLDTIEDPVSTDMEFLAAGSRRHTVTAREKAGSSTLRELGSGESTNRRPMIYLIPAAILIAALGIGFYLRYPRDTTTVDVRSIAVLPFDDQTRDASTDYLADGIPESIINGLSAVSDLKVMSRNSSFRYREKEVDARAIGSALNVQAVLEGRIAQQGDGLMIAVELVNASDNSQIWGKHYNTRLSDLFLVQEQIAREIADKLRVKNAASERATPRQPTKNLRAFQLYSQGRSFYGRRTREDLLSTIQYFEKAVAEDPGYALAYAGLADAYGAMGARGYIAPSEARRKDAEYARRALELDPNLAEAHAAMGLVGIVFAPFDFETGDRELRLAIELNPSLAHAHQFLGHSLVEQGRTDEGLAEYLKARELDPLSPIIARNVATAFYDKRDYARALDLLRQADELGPAFTNPIEIGIYISNGLFDETLDALEKEKKQRPADPLLLYDTGAIYASMGRRTDALRIIKELETLSGATMSQAQFIARIYAILNDRDQAFAWLDRALNAGQLSNIGKNEPLWDPVRGDPRFADLLRRAGVPETRPA